MAVMVNSFGGGSGYRGEYYYREIVASSAVGSNQNLLSVTGEGRILGVIVGGSINASSYSDNSKTATAKITVDSGAKVLTKKAVTVSNDVEKVYIPILFSPGFSHDDGNYQRFSIPNFEAVATMAERGSKDAYFGPWGDNILSMPNLTENLPAGQQDYSCTFYQDGLFFDESFTIECSWQAYDSTKPNKIIVYYELFD